MSTTTIRLPDDLKARVAQAAEQSGTTAHNFILEAIAEKTLEHERRVDFNRVADARYQALVRGGKSISWAKMREYLQQRINGKRATRPAVRKSER